VDRTAAPLLEVRDVTAGAKVRGVSFELYPGEILGIAGLMGSGRSELARALFGIDRIDRGQIWVHGREVKIRRPDDAIRYGISLVPEDRRLQGLVLDHSVKDNLTLPLLGRLRRGGLIDDRRGKSVTESFVDSLQIRTSSVYTATRLLSGGNQQKVVIGKWLATEPDILIMDEPTAGVDIRAKTEILGVMRRLADNGKGVIVISSEPAELLAVSDRILIVQDGQVKRDMDRRAIASEEELHHAVQFVG
jgi:ribose transport system ATP-binding protein